jgi:hypothetical protein
VAEQIVCAGVGYAVRALWVVVWWTWVVGPLGVVLWIGSQRGTLWVA